MKDLLLTIFDERGRFKVVCTNKVPLAVDLPTQEESPLRLEPIVLAWFIYEHPILSTTIYGALTLKRNARHSI